MNKPHCAAQQEAELPKSFLDIVALPDYGGLSLAVTGTRALERFSDLIDGNQPPAKLKMSERFDVMDECLDMVWVRADLPVGFEFAGLSLADFWAALLKSPQDVDAVETWRDCLGGEPIAALREAARQRVAIRPAGTYLHSIDLWWPDTYQDRPLIKFQESLARLCATAIPQWKEPRRSRWIVELIEEIGFSDTVFKTRGKAVPKPRDCSAAFQWWRWEPNRLQAQGDLSQVDYHEYQFTLPSLETSYFSNHFPARNVFAQLRCTRFIDGLGQPLLLLDEVRSDWLRDLRLQQQGEPLPRSEVIKMGGDFRCINTGPVPECPVADDWLQIVMATFIKLAWQMNCAGIAWVPGRIQHELNPAWPLSIAQDLYDRDVPKVLRQILSVESDAPRLLVAYPSYSREVKMQYREPAGWFLVGPDGKDIDGPIKGRDALLNIYRAHSKPSHDMLPAFLLPQPAEVAEPADEGDDKDDDSDETFSPGHGDHWSALYDLENFPADIITRDLEDSNLVDQHPCVDVAHGSDRAEEVFCLRRGNAPLVHDVLVVSDSQEDSRSMFSAYPVLLDGIRHRVTLDHFEPWPHGIEAWAHVRVTDAEVSVCFFDTRYYAGSTIYQPGQALDVSLAGLAYFLRPIQIRAFEIKEGPLWEMEKQRRLDEGKSEQEAARPVTIHMTGGTTFLQLGGRNSRDDAQFQGVIDDVRSFEHDGQTIYRLEMVVMRPDDQSFRLPVFVSERALDGYVPQLGEDVEGLLWLQGIILGPAGDNPSKDQEG